MYRKLSKKEIYFMKKVLEVDFKGKQVLLRQLAKAKITYEEGSDYISLKFILQDVERYPYRVRVPVEMRAMQKNGAPIVFLVHVLDGFLDELEIITADSSRINVEEMELDKLEYIINEKVRC